MKLEIQDMKKDRRSLKYESHSESNGKEENKLLNCALCDYKCVKETTMTKHTNTKHNQFHFKCHKCENRFKCKTSLEMHKKSDHQYESVTKTKRKDKSNTSIPKVSD